MIINILFHSKVGKKKARKSHFTFRDRANSKVPSLSLLIWYERLVNMASEKIIIFGV